MCLTIWANKSFQRTRATKRLGVFGFPGVARGAERRRSPALRSGERGRGSGIRLSARRRANKRLEQTLRVVK